MSAHDCPVYCPNKGGERYLGSGVHHVDVVTAGVGLHQRLQHQLVLLTSSAETGQRLTAAAHRGLRGLLASASQ